MRVVGQWLSVLALSAWLSASLLACNVYDPTLIARGQSVQSQDAANSDASLLVPPDASTQDAAVTDSDLHDAEADSAIIDADVTADAEVTTDAEVIADAEVTTDARVPLSCPAMRGDCNDDPSDGCETDLSREPNCGQCNRVCEKLPFLHTCRHADDPATGRCQRPPCQCCNQLQGCE